MASSPSILKEFLVAIGFKVDDRSYKQFQSSLDTSLKKLEALGAVAAAVATEIIGATLKISDMGEKLYFAAQRAQTSVRNLQAIQFAAQNVGIGADEASAALANMATNIRTNLATPFIFRLLGIRQSADDVENLIAILERIKTLTPGTVPYVQATNLIAQNFGIDEPTLNMMLKNLPTLESSLRKRLQMGKDAGLDADKFAKDSHDTMMNYRTLQESASILAQVFTEKVLPAENKMVETLQKIANQLDKLSEKTNGWSTVLLGVASAFGATTLGKWLLGAGGRLLGMGGAEAAAEGAGAAAGAEVGGEAGSLGGPLGVGVGIAVGAGLGWIISHWGKVKGMLSRATGNDADHSADIIGQFEGKRLKPYNDIGGHATIGYGHKILPGEDYSGGISNGQALHLLMQDTNKALDAVHRLVHVALTSNQTSALTDLLFNIGETRFAHSGLLKQLNAGNYAGAADALLQFDKARVNGALVSNTALAERRRADRELFLKPDVTMTQTTNINVNGVDDPNGAGKQIGKEQSRVNGDLLRNLQGAVQ